MARQQSRDAIKAAVKQLKEEGDGQGGMLAELMAELQVQQRGTPPALLSPLSHPTPSHQVDGLLPSCQGTVLLVIFDFWSFFFQ